MTVFAPLLVVLFVTGCTNAPQHVGVFPPHHVSRLVDGIAVLSTHPPNVSCAGTYLPDGRIVTAAHCLQAGLVAATYSDYHASIRQWVPYQCEHRDDVRDIAVISPTASANVRHGALVIGAAPTYGQRVAVFGHPSGLTYSFGLGVVSWARRHRWGADWTQATTSLWFGNSGGPLIDEWGYLIGVASMIKDRVPHLALFAHRDAIETAINAPMGCEL